ncbi:hypothetical protein R3P38DRAFT_2764079 [Favolaschia claudopus]|uniref:HECT domain-containing protein n=1 Tax=Favolaschia claudopus TaxID=2862362 RepID=A0AAW0D9B2_9AGAR
MSEAPFTIPNSYAGNLDDPVNAAQTLCLAVAAFMDDKVLPLDSLYTNLEPCKLPVSLTHLTVVEIDALRQQQDSPRLHETISELLPAIIQFIQENGPQMWAAVAGKYAGNVDSHIASLAIPRIGGIPSVLLRDLGQFATAMNSGAESKTFSSGQAHTRLTLEGLCQNWGLYLVGAIDSNGIGSTDLRWVLEVLIPRETYGFTTEVSSHPHAISKNLDITHRCLRKLLLCRLLVFSIFAEHVHSVGLKPEHKKLWLLIQALPKSLRCSGYIRQSSYRSGYRDADGYYPVLREIVDALFREFRSSEASFVTSGTSIPKSGFTNSPNAHRISGVRAPGHSTTKTDTENMFYATCLQIILNHLPGKHCCSSCGDGVVDGPVCCSSLGVTGVKCTCRHRITDSFMGTLTRDGFHSPHTLLNDYIEAATGYRPRDCPEFITKEREIRERIMVSRIPCELLALPTHVNLASTLRDVLIHYAVAASHPRPFTADQTSMVTTGFGRFIDQQMSQMSSNAKTRFWTFYSSPLTSSRVYPASLVLYLSRVFAENPRVHEVFTFPGAKPKWANKRAEIVSLGSVEPGYASVDLGSEVVAAAPLTLEDTVSWLTNETLSLPPFCLGQSHDSPDIIFGLRLEDGTLKRVLIHTTVTTSNLRGDPLRKVISDSSDENLFKDDDDPTVHDRAITALRGIPQTAKGPRKSPILRVFASFPGTLRLGNVTHAPNLAQLNNAKFSKIIQTIPASSIFEKIVKSVTLQLGKRKRSTAKSSGSRKRMKRS